MQESNILKRCLLKTVRRRQFLIFMLDCFLFVCFLEPCHIFQAKQTHTMTKIKDINGVCVSAICCGLFLDKCPYLKHTLIATLLSPWSYRLLHLLLSGRRFKTFKTFSASPPAQRRFTQIISNGS